jgi:hypothetical protein
MSIFQGMSPEEKKETIGELLEILGDDSETKADLERLLGEVFPDIESNSDLKKITQDDELAPATHDALRLLKGSSWEAIWEKQDIILEGVLASGQLSPEDAAKFETDEAAWEKELRFIWDELQKQAAEL